MHKTIELYDLGWSLNKNRSTLSEVVLNKDMTTLYINLEELTYRYEVIDKSKGEYIHFDTLLAIIMFMKDNTYEKK